MKKNNKKGFTIVELVIVIAVIAILSAVLIPTFSNITNKAKESAALQKATNAMTEYLADNSDNVTDQKELLIDAGDYVVYVSLDNEKTVQKATDIELDWDTAIAEGENVAAGSFKKITADDGSISYEKVTEDTTADSADTYYAAPVVDDYTYYGTFEGCEVYTKN